MGRRSKPIQFGAVGASLGAVALVVVCGKGLWWTDDRLQTQPERSPARWAAGLVAEGVRIQELEPDGSFVELAVGEIRFVPGRISILRTPLLDRLELRDVRITRDGEPVYRNDVVRVNPILARRALPALLGDPLARDSALDLGALLGIASRSISPKPLGRSNRRFSPGAESDGPRS